MSLMKPIAFLPGDRLRVDYLYIGEFIKYIKEKKIFRNRLPVFTATATKCYRGYQKYFKDKLNLDLELYTTRIARTNLRYRVLKKDNEEENTILVRDLLTEKCPTIIYVSEPEGCFLAHRLTADGYPAKPYHGRMDKEENTKSRCIH